MHKINRFVPLVALLAASLPLTAVTVAAAEKRPNIIIVFTDDQGYTDLGIHGIDPDVRTPNIDQLARDGVLFTNGYATAPQCVPSRAGLMTARHQNAFGLEDNMKGPLPRDETTIAQRLRAVGYVTGMVGKWHLDVGRDASNRPQFREDSLPHMHGFDEMFSGNMSRYHATFDLQGNDLKKPFEVVDQEGYRVDIQTDAALAFLDRRTGDDRPFFLYLGYFAPHSPVQDPPEYMQRMAHVEELVRRMGLASILAMDDGVGRIREKLKEMGVDDNTLIFFMSDNGAPLREGAYVGSLNHPLVGEKGMQTDGGQRIPYVAAWPGVIPPGQVFELPVSTMDAAATAIAAAGAPLDEKIEGVDLRPWLTGKETGPVHDELCWRWRSQSAILTGDGKWKFIRLGQRQRFLFDMTEIGRQTTDDNLIRQHPEIAAQLEARLKAVADTWKIKGLPGDPVVRPDQDFYDQHVNRTLPPLPLDAGMTGAFVPTGKDSVPPPGGALNAPGRQRTQRPQRR